MPKQMALMVSHETWLCLQRNDVPHLGPSPTSTAQTYVWCILEMLMHDRKKMLIDWRDEGQTLKPAYRFECHSLQSEVRWLACAA